VVLTPRELEILEMIAEGMSNRTIAAHLGISGYTVKFHVASILAKLGAASRTEAVTLGGPAWAHLVVTLSIRQDERHLLSPNKQSRLLVMNRRLPTDSESLRWVSQKFMPMLRSISMACPRAAHASSTPFTQSG
jgi:DNA-binding CsgD family transcriptional regulator